MVSDDLGMFADTWVHTIAVVDPQKITVYGRQLSASNSWVCHEGSQV